MWSRVGQVLLMPVLLTLSMLIGEELDFHQKVINGGFKVMIPTIHHDYIIRLIFLVIIVE